MVEKYYPSGLLRPEYVLDLFDQLDRGDQDIVRQKIGPTEDINCIIKDYGYWNILNLIPTKSIIDFLTDIGYEVGI